MDVDGVGAGRGGGAGGRRWSGGGEGRWSWSEEMERGEVVELVGGDGVVAGRVGGTGGRRRSGDPLYFFAYSPIPQSTMNKWQRVQRRAAGEQISSAERWGYSVYKTNMLHLCNHWEKNCSISAQRRKKGAKKRAGRTHRVET